MKIAWATGRWLVLAAIAVVAAVVLVPMFLGNAPVASGPNAAVGKPAPVFALQDDLGAPASLDHYRGKVVVLNLWASWCPPCRAEMPDLQRLAQRYPTIAVIGVNEGESAERARAFAQSLRIGFPIWVDSSQQYGRVFASLGLPTTIVVSRDGTVVRGFDGALTFAQMSEAVAPLTQAR